MIRDTLIGKTASEKANLKAAEIVRLTKKKRHTCQDIDIEIVDIEPIDGGVQVFARAWRNGKQLGFGTDGTIDIERFRIFNSPVLIPDPNGDIVQQWNNDDGITHTRTLREDPQAALIEVLAHSASASGKVTNSIITGTIGHTTDTFYPSAGSVSPVDGRAQSTNASYATAHSGGTLSALDNETSQQMRNDLVSTTYHVIRHFYLFDTSTIGSGQAISSATLSLYNVAFSGNTNAYTTIIVASTPASNSTIATSDFNNIGSTAMSDTQPLQAGWNTGAYTDFALNASGVSNITTTGVSKFGSRLSGDINNQTPTGRNSVEIYFADQTGTTNDPKLVVVHSASATTTTRQRHTLLLMGVG